MSKSDLENNKQVLINQTKTFIESVGGWRNFYGIGEKKTFFKQLKSELDKIGATGLITGPVMSFSGLAEVIRMHGNNAYFLHYVYVNEKHGLLDQMFLNSGASVGARNRIKIITDKIIDEYKNRNRSQPFVINSLGGGLGFIECVIAGTFEEIRINVVDIDQDVLKKGSEIASINGISSSVRFIKDEAVQYVKKNNPSNIVITMGIIDYLQKPEAIEFIQELKKGVQDGGTLIVTAIGPHRLNKLASIFGLSPVYKTKEDVVEILEKSGCSDIAAELDPSGKITIAHVKK